MQEVTISLTDEQHAAASEVCGGYGLTVEDVARFALLWRLTDEDVEVWQGLSVQIAYERMNGECRPWHVYCEHSDAEDAEKTA